jgi:transposase
VCVVDTQGKIVKEAKVASDPEDLIAFFASLGFAVTRIGLEAGPLSQWLQSGLKCAGLEVVLLETRHVKAALSAMTVKTDRKDARGALSPQCMTVRLQHDRHKNEKSIGTSLLPFTNTKMNFFPAR